MPRHVDTYVGQRMRQRRWELGMTQTELAEKVGVRFQQIQKYEMGTNRVSASRLWDIAEALEVPAAYFFHGLNGAVQRQQGNGGSLLGERDSIELVRAYHAMPEKQRQKLLSLVRVLAESCDEGAGEPHHSDARPDAGRTAPHAAQPAA